MKKISKKKKRILIVSSVLVVIMLICLTLLTTRKDNPENYTSVEQFESIEDVIRYMGCTYIKQQKSKDSNFKEDIYAKFKVDLYEGETSNERFYNQLIELVIKVSDYESVRILDKDRDITIEIQCNTNQREIEKIAINGIEDYFAKEDSRRALENKKNEYITNVTIQASQIKQAITSKWLPRSVNFGTKESEFEGEDIYFDEGIRIKNVSGRIYRMVFTKKYPYEVVNGIKVGTSLDEIKKVLGVPTFDSQETVIGYRTNEIYIFFSEEEIAVYRVEKQDNTEFLNIVNQYLEDSDFQKFTNQLTTMWQDYDNYIANDYTYELRYTLKGIKIQVSNANKDGIHIYSNYQGFDNVLLKEKLDTGKIHIHGNEDLVYLQEINRIAEQKDMAYRYDSFYEYTEQSKNLGKSKLFSYYVNRYDDNSINKISFLSQNENYPDCELKANINTYIWLNDRKFIYTIANKGIYVYDLIDRNSQVLLEGKENFNIISIEDGNILKYDNKAVRIQF